MELKNRKASFEYFFLEEFTAGLVLAGMEVKSLREGGGSITEAFCTVTKGEAFILNMHIPPYKDKGFMELDPKRPRKLLLERKEIDRLERSLKDVGLTIVPIKIFDQKGFLKLRIALAKGKKQADKRQSLKEKDLDRDAQRSS
jgi:SsrA-binding protein